MTHDNSSSWQLLMPAPHDTADVSDCETPSTARSFSEHRAAGMLAALASAAAFGASGPFVKPLLDAGWSPAAAVAVRAAAAGVVLLPLGLAAVGWRLGVITEAWRRIVVFGLIAVGGTQLCYFAAVEHLPVGIALLIEYLGPVLLVGFTWITSGVRPSRLTLVGATVATGGLFLVLDLTGAAGLDPIGIAWAGAAAVCLACYFALSAQPVRSLPTRDPGLHRPAGRGRCDGAGRDCRRDPVRGHVR